MMKSEFYFYNLYFEMVLVFSLPSHFPTRLILKLLRVQTKPKDMNPRMEKLTRHVLSVASFQQAQAYLLTFQILNLKVLYQRL